MIGLILAGLIVIVPPVTPQEQTAQPVVYPATMGTRSTGLSWMALDKAARVIYVAGWLRGMAYALTPLKLEVRTRIGRGMSHAEVANHIHQWLSEHTADQDLPINRAFGSAISPILQLMTRKGKAINTKAGRAAWLRDLGGLPCVP